MGFSPKYSCASTRLEAQGSDLWAVHTDAMAQLEAGADIIMMSVGDPDLPTIERIIEHAVTSLYRGRTHYSPGMGELHLRETIAEIETQASGKLTTPDQVIVFPGATNAVFSTLSCLLDADDELIVVEPAYVGYEGIFSTIGSAVIRIPALADQGFAVDTEAIRAAITDRTRVLLLNTPGNPAGNIIPEDQLRSLSELCYDRDIWLVCDEVYSMITFEHKHISARKAANTLENIIVIDGLSKSHAMTGWRLGWAVAPAAVAQRLLSFTSATVFGCSQFIQDAAAFAMKNDGEYIQGITQEYRERRDYACKRIREIDGLNCQVPQAGMFLMIDVSAVSPDGFQFARALLDEQGVSVLPGEGFGEITRQFVRLSLTHPVKVLDQAFARIEAYVRNLP